MADLDRPRARASEPAGDMHQAAEIADEHRRRAGPGDVAQLGVDDGGGDFRIFDREGAAEAAAHLAVAKLDQRQPATLASRRRGASRT